MEFYAGQYIFIKVHFFWFGFIRVFLLENAKMAEAPLENYIVAFYISCISGFSISSVKF